MELTVHPGAPRGAVAVPGSKSHAVRAALFAALADGESTILAPPDSLDVRAAAVAARALGADLRPDGNGAWRVRGVAGVPRPPRPGGRAPASGADRAPYVVDVANSGTTLYLALAAAALAREGAWVFDGDGQLRRRSAAPLAAALNALGARVDGLGAAGSAPGACPLRVAGTLRGGRAALACATSQYLSALMLAAPLAAGDTALDVTEVCERPYLEITEYWLRSLGVRLERADDWSAVRLPGGQAWGGFARAVPGDWSAATFWLVAGALSEPGVEIAGLDPDDPQGDRGVVDVLRAMGASVEMVRGAEGGPRVRARAGPRGLRGVDVDLADMPDAVPALAVAAAYARGRTRLTGVAHARRKETDRLAVMARELGRLGARIEERPDGLVVDGGGGLRGGRARGHGDHRVVMALAVAGLFADAPVTVDTAEAAGVTYPGFADALAGLGARVAAAG